MLPLEVDDHSQSYDSGHIQLLCVFNQKMRNDYNKEFVERILIKWDINADVHNVWKCLTRYFKSIFSVQNGRNWWNWSFRCQFITFASILHGKILFRRLFRMLSLWFTQMHHNASNKGYRPTFTFLSTYFGPSDNRFFVLSCSYWSRSYYSGAIRSKKQ